jgi:Lrp/AsnC family leucine-responsive transcriptional regulator
MNDERDWIILEHVQRDARVSFAELGRQAGLSPPAAAERLRRLENAGIVRGYHAAVSVERLGLGMTVLIEMHVPRPGYARFQKAIETLGGILECHHVSGRASFMLKAAVPDVAGLESLVGHLSQFGETSTSLVLSTLVQHRVVTRPAIRVQTHRPKP